MPTKEPAESGAVQVTDATPRDDNAAIIRDRAIAEARAAEHRVAELECGMRDLLEHFKFAASHYVPGTTAHRNAHYAMLAAKKLLGMPT